MSKHSVMRNTRAGCSTLKPRSFNTGKVVTVKMSTQHFPDGKGSNVIGMIRGSDPELNDETIIIGTHLDHLGRCYEIIPGANDNASAVAVMMGLARALKENKIPLKRTVRLIAFGSEEQALAGSKEYLARPAVPLEKSVLLNMDGVGIGHSIAASAGKDYMNYHNNELCHQGIDHQIPANRYYQAA